MGPLKNVQLIAIVDVALHFRCTRLLIEANNYSPLERELWSSPLIGTLADPIDTIHDNEERLGQGGSEDWPEAVDAPQDQ